MRRRVPQSLATPTPPSPHGAIATRRNATSPSSRPPCALLAPALIFLWVLALVWGEWLQYVAVAHRCRWPDLPGNSNARHRGHRLALVADPQLTDRGS